MTPAAIAGFLHAQVACWNAGERVGFLDAYRQAAPGGLTIEYVGRSPVDGWAVLDAMWTRQASLIHIEVVQAIVNGSEAACHHRNHVRASGKAIETMELYRFAPDGTLAVRYFIAAS